MGEITEQSYFEAQNRLEKAEQYRDEAQEAANMDFLSNEGEAITDCQRAIEHSAKSLFLLVDMDMPRHDIDPQQDRVENLIENLKSELPDRYPIWKVGRLMTLFSMAAGLYPTSEQGIQTSRTNIDSADMFKLEDVRFLFHFADESVIIATQTINYAGEEVF